MISMTFSRTLAPAAITRPSRTRVSAPSPSLSAVSLRLFGGFWKASNAAFARSPTSTNMPPNHAAPFARGTPAAAARRSRSAAGARCFLTKRYSVPFAWVGRLVDVRGTALDVVVRGVGEEIARHRRRTRALLLLDESHYEGLRRIG